MLFPGAALANPNPAAGLGTSNGDRPPTALHSEPIFLLGLGGNNDLAPFLKLDRD
jgi:hypothetical protein